MEQMTRFRKRVWVAGKTAYVTKLTTTAAVPMIAKIIGTPMQSDFLILSQLILAGVILTWYEF